MLIKSRLANLHSYYEFNHTVPDSWTGSKEHRAHLQGDCNQLVTPPLPAILNRSYVLKVKFCKRPAWYLRYHCISEPLSTLWIHAVRHFVFLFFLSMHVLWGFKKKILPSVSNFLSASEVVVCYPWGTINIFCFWYFRIKP